jgi:hypothetical protein
MWRGRCIWQAKEAQVLAEAAERARIAQQHEAKRQAQLVRDEERRSGSALFVCAHAFIWFSG